MFIWDRTWAYLVDFILLSTFFISYKGKYNIGILVHWYIQFEFSIYITYVQIYIYAISICMTLEKILKHPSV